jgi:adenylate cyclase
MVSSSSVQYDNDWRMVRKMTALLKILSPVELQREHRIEQQITTVGRSPDNTIRIDRPSISPVHISIVSGDNKHLLIDHSSKFGTQVNGVRIDRKALVSGNQIKLGLHALLSFEVPHQSEGSHGDGRANIETGQRPDIASVGIRKRLTLEEAGFEYGHEPFTRTRKSDMQRNYLSTIYQVNQSITEVFDLAELSNKVLDLIVHIFSADRYAVMLSEPGSENFVPIAFKTRETSHESGHINLSRTIIRQAIAEKSAILAKDTFFDERFRDVSSIIRKGIRSVLCVPLHTRGKVLGALYVDALGDTERFSEEDLGLLFAVGGALANSIENTRLVEKIKDEDRKLSTLERYLPSVVVEHLFHQQGSAELGGKHALISVLFADIRGFASLAEHTEPVDVVRLLNNYFTAMSEIVFEYGGTLGEYIGDEIMAYFGAPIERKDHARCTIAVALKMMEKIKSFWTKRKRTEEPALNIGIGIATGPAVAGNIGSAKQMKYTVIGNTVNIASRLCARAEGGQILISRETKERIGELAEAHFLEHAFLKGISMPVEVYEVIG